MEKNELLQIGIDFRAGKYPNETWESLNENNGCPFKSGEGFRCFVKKQLKKDNKLPTVEAVRNEELEEKLSDLEFKTIELKKERIKNSDLNTKLNKIIRESAREEVIRDYIINAVEKLNKKKPFVCENVIKNGSNKTGVLQLSDWHFGIVAKNFLNEYNSEVFERRIEKVVEKTIEYAELHKIEELYILLQGDFISSSIHTILRIQNQEDIITQIIYTSEVLANIIQKLSEIQKFKIKISLVTDNHSRVSADKKESLNEENFIRITEWFLKTRLKNNKNVEFFVNEIGLDMSTFKIYDYNCIAVHGDKDSFKTLASNLTTFTRQIYDYAFTSHNHHLNIEELNMVTVISNGCLSGVDVYSADLRLSSNPLQNFHIFNKKEGLECIYPIKLK